MLCKWSVDEAGYYVVCQSLIFSVCAILFTALVQDVSNPNVENLNFHHFSGRKCQHLITSIDFIGKDKMISIPSFE